MNSEKSKSPLVSIITINYKQLLLTIDLIKSLKEITYPNYELVIVDNNSQEDLTPIELKFPSVKLIKSSKNLGFAGGNNLGLKQAKGDYILYLNNDTIVEKSFLEPLVNCFIENPNTGLVSPKIRYYDERNRIQFAGYTDLSKITLRNSIIGYGEIDKNQFNKRTKTAFSHGAAMMTTRKILNQSGLMSELYFLYYEELDFGIRIRTTRSIGMITSPTLLDLNEIFPELAPDISPKRIEPLLSSIRVGSSVASSCAIALGDIALPNRKKTVPKIKVNRLLRIIGNPNSYLTNVDE